MTKKLINSLVRLRQDESGQGLVEYLLILALVAFAATAGMTTLASGLNSAFSKIGDSAGQLHHSSVRAEPFCCAPARRPGWSRTVCN